VGLDYRIVSPLKRFSCLSPSADTYRTYPGLEDEHRTSNVRGWGRTSAIYTSFLQFFLNGEAQVFEKKGLFQTDARAQALEFGDAAGFGESAGNDGFLTGVQCKDFPVGIEAVHTRVPHIIHNQDRFSIAHDGRNGEPGFIFRQFSGNGGKIERKNGSPPLPVLNIDIPFVVLHEFRGRLI